MYVGQDVVLPDPTFDVTRQQHVDVNVFAVEVTVLGTVWAYYMYVFILL